jgi:glycosyltransferase involved in cell wall biosynthesis
VDAKKVVHATGASRALRELALRVRRLDGALRAGKRPPADGSRSQLRIVAFSPTYVPRHRRGAEVTLHLVLAELRERGHEVRVVAGPDDVAETLDGVEVRPRTDRRRMLADCDWADVVVGQLTDRWTALSLGARSRRPVVYFMHIGGVGRRALYGDPDLTVFCSDALRRQHPWIQRSIVLHPPVVEARYLTTPGDAITLVNLTEAKGAALFATLARRMPEREFLAVRGWEDDGSITTLPSNCTVLDQVDDMRAVYARTRVLLMPSEYEAYGRVGLEAAVSGIPTIAHPTEGLSEALGSAAMWADRADADAWLARIRALDDPSEYTRRSAAARAQFEHLDPRAELDGFERALIELRAARSR